MLVSGATSGIGLAIAQGFARLGAEVVATGTSAAKLSAVGSDPANAAIRFDTLDVRDRREIDGFIGALPSLDVLINAAGVARPEAEWEEETYLDVIDINLNSAMRLAMAAHPHLARSKGAIINIASMLSYLADDSVPAYCASKTGILGLTRALAHKFGPDGIRVNAIAPGYHKTAMTQALWSDPGAGRRDRPQGGSEALGDGRRSRWHRDIPGLARCSLRHRHEPARRRRIRRRAGSEASCTLTLRLRALMTSHK